MPTSTNQKIACVNPNTGRIMNIDASVYELFSKAIYHTLKKNKQAISFTDLLDGVKQCFKQEKTAFKGSIGWYTVGIKSDMVSKGVIETFEEKGKKMHRLKK